MANQTELLNVSDEMKLDDERQSFEGLECGEGLCSSLLPFFLRASKRMIVISFTS